MTTPDYVHYDVDPHGVQGDTREWAMQSLCDTSGHAYDHIDFTNKVEHVTCPTCAYLLSEIANKVNKNMGVNHEYVSGFITFNTNTEEYEFTAITRYDGFFVKNS